MSISDQPQVTMIAVFGARGNIGPGTGPIVFRDREIGEMWAEWFGTLVEGGNVVVGSNTYHMMRAMGWSGRSEGLNIVPWTRKLGLTPDEFLSDLKRQGKPIFIAGGRKTFELFMPYVEQFFLRRAEIASPHYHTLPPLFPMETN